jgi:hypothetical protein
MDFRYFSVWKRMLTAAAPAMHPGDSKVAQMPQQAKRGRKVSQVENYSRNFGPVTQPATRVRSFASPKTYVASLIFLLAAATPLKFAKFVVLTKMIAYTIAVIANTTGGIPA